MNGRIPVSVQKKGIIHVELILSLWDVKKPQSLDPFIASVIDYVVLCKPILEHRAYASDKFMVRCCCVHVYAGLQCPYLFR